MSPNYVLDPAAPKVVARKDWYRAGAAGNPVRRFERAARVTIRRLHMTGGQHGRRFPRVPAGFDSVASFGACARRNRLQELNTDHYLIVKYGRITTF